MEDRYLFKAKKKNWQELPKDEQWVQGYLFDDGFENGRMFVGGLVVEKYTGTACDDWTVTGVDFYEIDPNTICQCTGLKDKNGKLIWEDDIIECKNGKYHFQTQIEWDAYCAGFIFQDTETSAVGLDAISTNGLYSEIEVIGNIFDNKELLESEE